MCMYVCVLSRPGPSNLRPRRSSFSTFFHAVVFLYFIFSLFLLVSLLFFLFLLLFACSSYFVFESCMYVTVVLSEGHVMRMALARRWMGLLRMVTVGIKYFCVAT